MKTRVSVIIPVYNVQEFLAECIDSVLNQTINHLELEGYDRNLQIILVDDGSTDDSSIIAKEYADSYENIGYVYEENQGLGHARNYGCEFANGDYIIFLDSDDIVDPKAYERMYKLAVKNNSDLTIGNVWNFNSQSIWPSKIHDIAFSGTNEVTHITESPELVYDTTAWNKLIKRDFWEKHEFEFPEGILYEDIPITVPMHFLANNVSMVHEMCYLWRVRDGISKSITQTTESIKTLKDRLYVMDLVDDFFEKNVFDDEVILAKDIKWINNDLMIFINILKKMSKEESEPIMNILCDYIHRKVNFDNFKYLNEIQKLKYKYLLDGDYTRLINLLNFELEDLQKSKVYSKDSHWVIDCDEEISKKGYLIMDDYFKEIRKRTYLKEVSFKKKHLEIQGFAIIPGFKTESFDEREYSFYLYNENSGKKVPINHENIKINDLSSFYLPFRTSVRYNHAGYKIKIPYTLIRDNKDFIGENRILVTFKQHDITYNFFAGIAKKDVRNKSDLKAIMRGDNYFCIKYDICHQFILDVHPIRHRYEEISVTNNRLCISTPKFFGKVFACYEEDEFNEKIRIPLDYDEENNLYFIELKDLPNLPGQLKYEDDEILVHKWKQYKIFKSDVGTCTVNALNDYHYDITKYENFTEIISTKEQGNTITLNTELNSTQIEEKSLKSVKLLFRDNKNHIFSYLADGEFSDDTHVSFKFNINDKAITKNLYQGFFDILAEYDFGDLKISTPLHYLKSFKHPFSDKSYDYSVYRSGKWTLRINSKRKWPSREDTKQKREKIAENEYEFFRKLPINPKRIMFESMWGAKYSCNPRYLYEFIDENYPEYECIWSLNDEHIPIKGNGIRVRKDSLKYFYYLATSKFFVNNVNFDDHYIKREGQIEIQTMHGTPLKTLGLDVPGDFKTKKQEEDFIKKCGRWNYMTVQSDYASKVSTNCFRFKKKVLNHGYPRTDMLYSKNNENDINELKKKIGLPLNKKIILYAPTWRQKNKFELMLDLRSLKKALSDEYILILRLHHLSFKDWTAPKNDDFVYDLSRYDSIEELYLVSDLLITDYSSVMFDYANLDRPMILFTYDLKEYREKLRGFYMDIIENRPGPLVYTSKELETSILNIDEIEKEYGPIRQKFREKFNQYESGNSSQKIFDEVMVGNEEKQSIFNKIVGRIFSRIIN